LIAVELRLQEWLNERGIEQKEVVERTGLSTRTVSELCTNKMQRVPREAIGKIAQEFGIKDANELFKL